MLDLPADGDENWGQPLRDAINDLDASKVSIDDVRYVYLQGGAGYGTVTLVPPCYNDMRVVAVGYFGLDDGDNFTIGRIPRQQAFTGYGEGDFLANYGSVGNSSGESGKYGEINTDGVENSIGDDACFVAMLANGNNGGIAYLKIDTRPDPIDQP